MTQAAKVQTQQEAPEIKIIRRGYARGVAIPWQLKMWIKIILSRIPFSYKFLSGLGMFRHGDTSRDLTTLYKSFNDHLTFFKARTGRAPESCLELGPGDSVGHALCAKAKGAKASWLIDVGDFASTDEDHYRQICGDLKLEPEAFTRDAILEFTNGQYKTNGLAGFGDIPDGSVEFSFSHAVLEHVRRGEFQDTMNALYRVHKPGSVSRHWVDPHDHLGGALNSFRFSLKFWESHWVQNAGFYTNRLSMAEVVKMAEKAGFYVTIEREHRWESLPTPRESMDASFEHQSDEELNVCTYLMIMEKK